MNALDVYRVRCSMAVQPTGHERSQRMSAYGGSILARTVCAARACADNVVAVVSGKPTWTFPPLIPSPRARTTVFSSRPKLRSGD